MAAQKRKEMKFLKHARPFGVLNLEGLVPYHGHEMFQCQSFQPANMPLVSLVVLMFLCTHQFSLTYLQHHANTFKIHLIG
jgi:hypothetical protein